MEQEKINRLQWILDDAVARGEIPGAILMVRREGKETVYLESGYADIEAKKPVARDSIYRLYSMSKPITATAVMILVERGMIDLAEQAGATISGMGFIIEKAFQDGGKALRESGIHVESLAIIDNLDDCKITIR